MPSVTNIAAYRFAPLADLPPLRERLLALCKSRDLRGTILLSPEGINLFVAGAQPHVELLLADLRGIPGLEALEPKVSVSAEQPFTRMLVKIKKEIIAFGVPGIDPAGDPAPRLSPRELKRWLDEGRPVTLLDTRNDFEVKLGTFRGATPIGIEHFRDFPNAVTKLPEEWKRQPVVTFCTGGIRCEKAAPYLRREGFEQVYQLDGGILKYFEECGGAHYQGECFVFDKRVGLEPDLGESPRTLCFACQTPLGAHEQLDPRFVESVSCPNCFRSPEESRIREFVVHRAALAECGVKLLREDAAMIFVEMPAEMRVEATGGSDRDSLQAILRRVYAPQRPRPVHGADAESAGVAVFARTAKIAASLRNRVEGRGPHADSASAADPREDAVRDDVQKEERDPEVGEDQPDQSGRFRGAVHDPGVHFRHRLPALRDRPERDDDAAEKRE